MKKTSLRSLVILLVLVMALSAIFVACNKKDEGFKYQHSPKDNPSAMADIVEDSSCVYGFRPSASGRLYTYADHDFTNPKVVEELRQERIKYHQDLESLYVILDEMLANKKDTETIARAISTKRNEIRLAEAKNAEEEAQIRQTNLTEWGQEEGPTPDQLYQKYGSWEMVLTKAFSVNSGADACLGLYDQYYEVYVAVGQIKG